jgi:hypothetical protein
VIGSDWGTDVDITATTNDCAVHGLRAPAPVGGGESVTSPPAIITPASGGVHVVDVKADMQVVDTYSTGSGWASRVVGGRYGGVSSPVFDDDAGTATVGVTEYETGDAQLLTLSNGQWQAPLSLKGRLTSTPAVVSRSDGTLAVYGTGQYNDSTRQGTGLVREQLPSGEFTAWRPFGDRSTSYSSTPSVISGGDETTIVVAVPGSKEWFRHTPRTTPVRKGRVNSNTTLVTLTGDGKDGVLAVGIHFRDGKNEIGLLREKADRSGFEDTWELVGGPLPAQLDSNLTGAQLLPNGSVAVTVIAGGKPLVTTSKAAGAREFHPWQQVTPDGYPHTFRAPAGLGLTRAGDVALAAKDGDRAEHLWRASVSPDPAAPLQFTGGKLG